MTSCVFSIIWKVCRGKMYLNWLIHSIIINDDMQKTTEHYEEKLLFDDSFHYTNPMIIAYTFHQ
jgi:hypothetical protein